MTPDECVEAAVLSDVASNVAAILIAAQDECARWRKAAQDIEQHLVLLMDSMEDKQLLIDGLGLFQRTRSQSRRAWDHDSLWRDIVRKALAERRLDTATGEVQTEIDSVLAAIRKAVSPSWKLTGLRDLGLDPDEYSEGSWSDGVKVTRP